MSATLPQVRVIADQVYSRAGGRDRLADLYIPETQASPAVVLWLHGGGWRFGDRRMAPDLAAFAAQSGLAVVSIDYRLSDEAKFPAQVEDVKTAVRWVRSVAGQQGLNTKRVGLWGSSAGGHLAACAALSDAGQWATPEHAGHSSAVQAVVDGYGPTNLARIDSDRAASAPVGDDLESLAIGDVLPAAHPESFESRLLGVPVSASSSEVQSADPVHYVRSGSPPFLILHGRADTLIPCAQSGYLFDALAAAGNDATLVLFENLKHGFFNNPRLAEENYGEVTVRRSSPRGQDASWVFDPAADIPSMVCAFLRAQLVPIGASTPKSAKV
jgi:acetyl esterase/lipase